MLGITVGVMHNNWINWTLGLLLAFDAGQTHEIDVGVTYGSSLELSSYFAARTAAGYLLDFPVGTLVDTKHGTLLGLPLMLTLCSLLV